MSASFVLDEAPDAVVALATVESAAPQEAFVVVAIDESGDELVAVASTDAAPAEELPTGGWSLYPAPRRRKAVGAVEINEDDDLCVGSATVSARVFDFVRDELEFCEELPIAAGWR